MCSHLRKEQEPAFTIKNKKSRLKVKLSLSGGMSFNMTAMAACVIMNSARCQFLDNFFQIQIFNDGGFIVCSNCAGDPCSATTPSLSTTILSVLETVRIRLRQECTSESAFSVSPSSSFLPPIAVHDSAFHLGNFQLLRKSNGQYRRQLPLPQPRSAPVCFAFSAPASRSARTAHLQALAAPKTGCARPIACRLQRRHRYS